jgi:hypothetical protein
VFFCGDGTLDEGGSKGTAGIALVGCILFGGGLVELVAILLR